MEVNLFNFDFASNFSNGKFELEILNNGHSIHLRGEIRKISSDRGFIDLLPSFMQKEIGGGWKEVQKEQIEFALTNCEVDYRGNEIKISSYLYHGKILTLYPPKNKGQVKKKR